MRNGAASDSSILEYSAYSNEINIWIISHATGSASIAKTFSDDDTVLKSNYEVTTTESYTEDCNDITEPGLFNQVINPDAVNGPGQYAYIVVYSASHFGMITQIAIPYNINGTLKVRTRELGTWRDWRTP